MDIPSERIFALVMGLSAGMAAIAGVLVAPFLTVRPDMGLLPMVKAFAVVIMGGLGSIRGSILAALVLGYAEALGSSQAKIKTRSLNPRFGFREKIKCTPKASRRLGHSPP